MTPYYEEIGNNMSTTETAASPQVFVLTTTYLQTAAVFDAWGWRVLHWRPLNDSGNGRKRAVFDIAVPECDIEQAREIERKCAANMGVPVPDVGAYNRAFQRLKREIEDEDMRNERSRTE